LGYEPDNVFAWSLWRDALAADGDFAAAVGLGWELIRRFPHDPFMRNQLAEILLAADDTKTAKHVVISAFEDGVENAVTYAIYARILAHEGNMPDALNATADGLQIESDNPGLINIRYLLENNQMPELVSNLYKNVGQHTFTHDSHASTLDALIADGKLRALRDNIYADSGSSAKIWEIYQHEPSSTYAQMLATRYGLIDPSSGDLPSVAVAFEAALSAEDVARLDALTERAPRLQALILLARALFGDDAAAATIAEMLHDRPVAEGDNVINILYARLRPVMTRIQGGESPGQAVQTEETLVRRAIYDVNEALAAPDVIAA
jgi:tetratricopeptide (TPR) repeat protein